MNDVSASDDLTAGFGRRQRNDHAGCGVLSAGRKWINRNLYCQRCAAGGGNFVTGRYFTPRVDKIVKVEVEGDAAIEGTPIHPVWVIDKQEFVELSELEPGDRLDTPAGPRAVTRVTLQNRLTSVYNLEVEGQHVYRVGEQGILVHNTNPKDCPLVQLGDATAPRRSVSISDQRRIHILDGDRTGGRHRPGLGKPGKSEFPAGMTDDDIIDTIIDVAGDPRSTATPGRGGRTVIEGTRNGVDIRVILESDGSIVSGFPTNVPRNPRR